jgi:hypothetical protein
MRLESHGHESRESGDNPYPYFLQFFEIPIINLNFSIKLTPRIFARVHVCWWHYYSPIFFKQSRYITWYQSDIAVARLEPWWRRSCSRCPARKEPRKQIRESDRRSGARCRRSTSTWRQEQISEKKILSMITSDVSITGWALIIYCLRTF